MEISPSLHEGCFGSKRVRPAWLIVCRCMPRYPPQRPTRRQIDAAILHRCQTFLECQLAADQLYGIDAPTAHYDVYNIESEALGAELIWRETEIPSLARKPLFSGRWTGGGACVPSKWGRRANALCPRDQSAPDGSRTLAKIRFTGLFTLAANLLGLTNLIMAIMTEPEKVHRLLSFLTEGVVAPWIICQRADCGRTRSPRVRMPWPPSDPVR